MTRRDTSQQRAIRQAIESAEGPLSIAQIHEIAADDCPGIGVRTVYRVIGRLVDDKVIAPVTMPGQVDRYEPAETAASHHHHCACGVSPSSSAPSHALGRSGRRAMASRASGHRT